MTTPLDIILHAQLKEHAQRIFAGLEIRPGNYNAAEVEKTMKFAEAYNIWHNTDFSRLLDQYTKARESFQEIDDEEHREAAETLRNSKGRRYLAPETLKLADEYNNRRYAFDSESAKYNAYTDARDKAEPLSECVNISCGTFTASMPAALVFCKLADWEKEFKIRTIDKAVFVREEEAEVIGSCTVVFPKETKYICEYAATEQTRPVMAGVYLDARNSCMVASDTHVLTEYPVEISDIEGEPLKLIIDPKVIKAVAGLRCEVKYLKDAEKNISIKTEKGDVYTCSNIKGLYPNYRRVYPKVCRDGLAELTKEGAAALASFAKSLVKQKKEKRGDGNVCIKIRIEAYADHGTAKYYDIDYMTEKTIRFAVKGSPRVNVLFGVDAFSLSIITKNWTGCLWYTDPSRPIVFDNIKSACTIVMPSRLDNETGIKPGLCTDRAVEALNRHDCGTIEVVPAEPKEEPKNDVTPRIINTVSETIEAFTNLLGQIKTEMDNLYYPEILNRVIEASKPMETLGAILGIIERWNEIEDIGNRYEVPIETAPAPINEPTAEQSAETPPEPPQTHETETPPDTSPGTENAVRSEIKDAPPIEQTIIQAPPEQIIIITPKPQPSKLKNNDRNNNLAPPHPHHRYMRLPRILYRPYLLVACRRHPLHSPDNRAGVAAVTVRPTHGGHRTRAPGLRPGEGHRRMGTEMGKETLHAQTTEQWNIK